MKKLIIITCLILAQLQMHSMDTIQYTDDEDWTTVEIVSHRQKTPAPPTTPTESTFIQPDAFTAGQASAHQELERTPIVSETDKKQNEHDLQALILSHATHQSVPPVPQKIPSASHLSSKPSQKQDLARSYSFAECCKLFFGIQFNRATALSSHKDNEQKKPLLSNIQR